MDLNRLIHIGNTHFNFQDTVLQLIIVRYSTQACIRVKEGWNIIQMFSYLCQIICWLRH